MLSFVVFPLHISCEAIASHTVFHSVFYQLAKNTPKIAIFRICYGENGMVKFFETLADNVFRHNYSMMQMKDSNRYAHLFLIEREYFGFNTFESVVVE
jgi:hypothetical protein